MAWRHSLVQFGRRLARRHGLRVVLILLLTYFGYHAIHGERGFLAWRDHTQLVGAATAELASLVARREELERRVRAFEHDHISPDLLEEELKKLGYVRPDEVIVLAPQAPHRGATGRQ